MDEVIDRSGRMDKIYNILRIGKKEYTDMVDKFKPELITILDERSYTRAAIELMRWLGIRDEDIKAENIVKGVLVVKMIVTMNNRLARLVWEKR